MLRVEGLRAGYERVEVLHGVSIEVAEGTIVAIIGANGAGKSTLIGSLSGVVQRMGGSIVLEGRDITRLSAPEIVDLGVIQVPEGRQLFGSLTVEENLLVGYHRSRRHGTKAMLRARLDLVHGLFPNLRGRLKQRAVTLSGGEQQMVALGRALMAGPRLLLLDEPSLGLAPMVVEQIFGVLRSLKLEGLTMLLVEERADAALELSDHGYVLAVGRVAAAGRAGDLRKDPRVKQSYLGEISGAPS